MNPDQYIISLARTFPTLEHKVSEYTEGKKFNSDRFLNCCGSTSGELHAALFIVNVWNPADAVANGWHFNAVEAIGDWDSEHRLAFLRWCASPRWP